MPRRRVEVMNGVSEIVRIREDARARRHPQLEAQAPLCALGAGLHADFHQALADGRVVAEARDVTDGVENWHGQAERAWSTGYCTYCWWIATLIWLACRTIASR